MTPKARKKQSIKIDPKMTHTGLPLWLSWQRISLQSRRPGWGRSPGEGKGYPTPVFWPEEFHRLYSPWGRKESDMTERLSLFTFT